MSVEGIGVAPKDAMDFWADKVPMSAAEYAALAEEARARAFFVSGLAKGDLLTEIKDSLGKALAEGTPFEEWKKGLAERLEKSGWAGAKPWRLETIFRTNMQAAYMAGRYKQMHKVRHLRPYWQYVAILDHRTRPSHAVLDGVVYPAESEFWDSYWPPNDFRCRCTVVSRSERQVEQMGLTVESRVDHLREHPDHGVVNTRPRAGFDRNVGKDWWAGFAPQPLEARDVNFKADKARCRGGQFADAPNPCAPPLRGIDPKHILPVKPADILARGLKPEEYARAFLGEFGIQGLVGSRLLTLPGVGLPVVVGDRMLRDAKTGLWKSDKFGRGPYMRLLARTIKQPYEIWQVPASMGGRHYDMLRLIRLFADEDGLIGGFGVFNYSKRGWLGVSIFSPKAGKNAQDMLGYLEKHRVGYLLYREE